MLKAVEFGLLAVSLLVILGLIVVGPGAYSRTPRRRRAGDRNGDKVREADKI